MVDSHNNVKRWYIMPLDILSVNTVVIIKYSSGYVVSYYVSFMNRREECFQQQYDSFFLFFPTREVGWFYMALAKNGNKSHENLEDE